jgi:uncharacterized protein (TIGR02147 family)
MVSIYDHSDYRAYLNSWIESQRDGGRGLKGRLAEAASISSTLISLILKGDKHLALEQASDIADFIGLSENETDYFFLLVELGRAGNFKLQQKLKRKIKALQDEAKKISKRVKKDIELSEDLKAIYYSNWVYTGVRNLIAIPGYNNPRTISEKLHLPLPVVNKVIDFLLETGLCVLKNGQLTYGPAHTHLESESPHVARQHQNWRLRGYSKMDQYNESNLFYTCPMSLSAEAAEEIRKMLPKFIEQVLKVVGPSPSEKAYCFNIDWFEY